MKTWLIIASFSLAFIACSKPKDFPEYPEITKHYYIDVKGEAIPMGFKEILANEIPPMLDSEAVRCMEFDILSWRPYKIKFNSQVTLSKCNMTGGFSPRDLFLILDWSDDVYSWAEKRKACFQSQ